jgi:hypothetical protein
MRPLLSLSAAALLLAGCGPGGDPALEAPCGERAPGVVLVGTGTDSFEPIPASGVDIQEGPQGGYHIWIGLRCQNLGPHVEARYGVTDLQTGQSLSLIGLRQAIDLTYDEAANADEVSNLYGYLSDTPPGSDPPPPTDLLFRKIQLWAKVNDQCGTPAESKVDTVVRGYNRL